MIDFLNNAGRNDTAIAFLFIWFCFILFLVLTVLSPFIYLAWLALDKYKGQSGWANQQE